MSSSNEEFCAIAMKAFKAIQEKFAHIEMELELAPPNVDLALKMEQQKGLAFPIYLNLQRDELHLNAGQ